MHVGYSIHKRVFTDQQKDDLKSYIKLQAKIRYGLTQMNVCKAALSSSDVY